MQTPNADTAAHQQVFEQIALAKVSSARGARDGL